jgi:casein kinase I family protein HRR25
MIYFCKGKLPWQGLQGGRDKMEKYNMITEKKFNTSVDVLCEGLPSKLRFI